MLWFFVVCCVAVGGHPAVAIYEIGNDVQLNKLLHRFQSQNVKHDETACEPLVFSEIKSLSVFDGTSWNVILNCSYSSSSPFDLSWHYKGERLLSITEDNSTSQLKTENLVIEHLSESNIGDYICLATSCAGFSDNSIWVNAPPVLSLNASVEQPLPLGSLVEGNCIAYPNSTLTWQLFKDGLIELPLLNEINNAYNEHWNSISTIRFFIVEPVRFIRFQCCIVEDQMYNRPACASVNVAVISKLELISFENSLINDSVTCLSCTFGGFPLPQLVIWSSCSLLGDCDYDFNGRNIAIYNFTGMTDVFTSLTILNSERNIYQCSAVNSRNESAFHAFNLTGGLIVPITILSSYSIVQSLNGEVDVTFQCLFISKMISGAVWLKTDKKSSTIITADNLRVFTDINFEDTDHLYKVSLTILSYSISDYGDYFCEIVTEQGITKSSSMAPHNDLDCCSIKMVSSRANNTFNEGEQVNLTCFFENNVGNKFSSSNLKIKVVSEFSLMYSTFYDDRFVNVSFIGDVMNNYVKVECESRDRNTRKDIVHILVNHQSVIVDIVSCTPDNFTNGNSCDLACIVQRSPSSLKKYHHWIYFAFTGNHSYYVLSENTSAYDVAPYRTNYTITLPTYYAGYYQCLISDYDPIITSPQIITYIFTIDENEDGSDLGEECSNSTQCLAYNAVCDLDLFDSTVCQCQEPHNIPMAFNLSTSACVGTAEPDELCYNFLQCRVGHRNFNCTDFNCQCDLFFITVAKLDENYTCLFPIKYGVPCLFSEECQLYDPNSICSNRSHTCECIDGYLYKDFKYSCGPENVLTPGVIAGVVIGSVAVTVLIVFFITFGRSKWKFQRQDLLTSELYAMDSSELEEETYFPQLNSFADFPATEEES